MNDQIRDELDKMLHQWQHGTPVRTLSIGHPTRATKNEHGDTVHDSVNFRQANALDCVFTIIQLCLKAEPAGFVEYKDLAQEIAREHQLSAEEEGAALSFAWVVLQRGWARALDGHSDRDYITVSKKADA